MTETAADLLEAGRLTDAVTALNGILKNNPTDVQRRVFLAELLCFAGNVDRADRMLDVVADQDPAAGVAIALFRQLLRGEKSREEVFQQGRVPDFLSDPAEHIQAQLRGVAALREGDTAGATAALEEAESLRPPTAGEIDGQAFDDMRDVDDVTGPVFEVVTSTGKYFWVPIDRVNLVEFRKPERTRDLYWRRALMEVEGGPDGEVFLPAIYPTEPDPDDERIRLGRATDWIGEAPTRGVGQRTFLIGDAAVPIMEIGAIEFRRGGH